MAKQSPVNIQFIAEICGVSIATVSRVINNSPHVSKEVMQKVKKAIKAYNYTPIAYKTRQRMQSEKQCYRIGVYSENFFSNKFLQAAGSYISLQGHDMRILDFFSENRDFGDILNADLAGIIAVGKMSELAKSKAANLPIVRAFGGEVPAYSQYDHVTYDGFQVGRLAADYLAKQGCELLVYYNAVDEESHHIQFSRRNAGFRERCQDLGLECTAFSMDASRLAGLDGNPEFKVHLKKKQKNVGYFLYHDLFAVSFYTMMMKNGLKPHEDFQMISCDNIGDYLSLIPIEVPSIDNKIQEIGEQAARTLLWRIENPDSARICLTLWPTLDDE